MDSPLAKYINKDVTSAIESVKVVQRTTKDGTSYCAIQLELINGYKPFIFAFKDEIAFAWSNAFDKLFED